jgi:hypothetical protein
MATPQPIDADQPNERLDGPSRRRRLLEGAGFVVVWVTLGYLFPGDDETYLLMGIPLTIAFQVAVRRRPLRELWVTDATRFSLDRRGLLFAAVFIAAPVYFGSTVLADGDWTLIGWYVAAVIGAVCVPHSRSERPPWLPCSNLPLCRWPSAAVA